MDILQDFQMFKVNEKLGMLQPDIWIVFNSYTTKSNTFYRVMYNSQQEIKPVGIIEHSLLEDECDKIELLGFKKYSKKDLKESKKKREERVE